VRLVPILTVYSYGNLPIERRICSIILEFPMPKFTLPARIGEVKVAMRGSEKNCTSVGLTVRKKVLFVCTANLQRSPTAEKHFQNWKGLWEAKSAGVMPVPEGNSLSQELVDWADLVICMEPEHAEYLETNFNCTPSKLKVLNIADRYTRDDPQLIRQLERTAITILEAAAYR
jgi:predicted protein tyrosine phosphatase